MYIFNYSIIYFEMKDRIFVITDERCGGTELGNLFAILKYRVIDDPQTTKEDRNPLIFNKQFVLDNLSFFYKDYDYVKICMISYTEEEYIKIVKQAVELNCKIIFLWRGNLLERALSRAIALETGVWTKKDYNKKYNSYFKLNIGSLQESILDNKKKLQSVENYLKTNSIKYYPLMYENIYNKDLNSHERLDRFYKLLEYIEPDILTTDIKDREIHKKLITSLSPNNKVNDQNSYKRIINIREIYDILGKFRERT